MHGSSVLAAIVATVAASGIAILFRNGAIVDDTVRNYFYDRRGDSIERWLIAGTLNLRCV